MPTRVQRQLLIGLDAMEWTLVLRWASQGKLPAFRGLLDQEARVELSSTAFQLAGHGLARNLFDNESSQIAKYFYVQYDLQSGDLCMLDDDAGITPVWEWILVEGRDRHGTVPPGAEYRKVRDGIAAALGELIDPRTGRNVVRQVTFPQEELQGPFLDRLPDVTVLWDHSFVWDEVASPRIGRLKLRRQDSRSGSHTPCGFLPAGGYGKRPGAELPRATLYDIAPTILSAAGVEPPTGMEGRPLFAGLEVR